MLPPSRQPTGSRLLMERQQQAPDLGVEGVAFLEPLGRVVELNQNPRTS